MSLKKPSLIKISIVAIRPFALPASTMPVVFGSVSAVIIEKVLFKPLLFVLAFFAMVLLHSAANILSDVNDYKRGLDTEPTPVSGAIIKGYISPKSALTGSIILFAIGFGLGITLVYYIGLPILIIGMVGIFIGIFYTLEPFALKYHALGDFAVFLDFGTLGALGAWTVQTGKLSWIPAVWAVPMSMLVVAIVHANNWRDIQSDVKTKINTVASIIGDRGSFIYYSILVFGAFGVVVLLILITRVSPYFTPKMPITFLIVFATFPTALILFKKCKRRREPAARHEFLTLDAGTSSLSLFFGLLMTLAVILHRIVEL